MNKRLEAAADRYAAAEKMAFMAGAAVVELGVSYGARRARWARNTANRAKSDLLHVASSVSLPENPTDLEKAAYAYRKSPFGFFGRKKYRAGEKLAQMAFLRTNA